MAKHLGIAVFWAGVGLALLSGILISIDPGSVCNLPSGGLPQQFWSYSALCFSFWAYSVPVGLILAATGILMRAGAGRARVWAFFAGSLATYGAVAVANGPIPHVPWLFGVGGALILLFYFLILWINAPRFSRNPVRLAGYTFLVIGLWFTCGLGSRLYHEALGSSQSPIDIMIYFVLAMGLFLVAEWRARPDAADGPENRVSGSQ